MASAGPLRRAVGQVRELLGGAARSTDLDRNLLANFIDRADASAFAAIVQRHGPMVLRACRRVLRAPEDAEDAWQATFLVLARKAASVRKRASVGSWLYGVALKVAANINRQAARRRAREYAAAHEPRPAGPDATWPEISEALDEELNRLPEQLKAPLVACYLEGKTRDEAARELGWGLDLLRGRLQRGRALLRSRLARRGLGLGAVLLATFLGAKGAAALSPAVQARIVEAASLAAAGRGAGGVVSARVLTLAEGALQAMHTKTKIVAALLLTLSIAVAATGWGFTQAGAPVQVGTRAAAATTAPAAAQAPAAQVDGGPVKELPDLVALAEKDVAIKKAALKAALAQKAIAEAKIKLLRSKGAGAEALVRVAKARLERFRDLQKQKAVEDRIVDEAEANYQSTVSARQEAEAAIQLGEAEIALEAARTEVAEAELDKATLQHKLLRDRLPRK